eukprot:scaffold84989_cov59-Attheya_sp.AAC.1
MSQTLILGCAADKIVSQTWMDLDALQTKLCRRLGWIASQLYATCGDGEVGILHICASLVQILDEVMTRKGSGMNFLDRTGNILMHQRYWGMKLGYAYIIC